MSRSVNSMQCRKFLSVSEIGSVDSCKLFFFFGISDSNVVMPLTVVLEGDV